MTEAQMVTLSTLVRLMMYVDVKYDNHSINVEGMYGCKVSTFNASGITEQP